MNNDWIQERIDELYLLEKQASERLGRLDVHYEKHLASIKSQEKRLNATAQDQKSVLDGLDKRLSDVHAWYRHVVSLGGIVTGLVIVGLVCIFLWWWHVDTLIKTDVSLKSYVLDRVKHLPYMVHYDGKTYIRIVPHAKIPHLIDKDGNIRDGYYAQVYHRAETDRGVTRD